MMKTIRIFNSSLVFFYLLLVSNWKQSTFNILKIKLKGINFLINLKIVAFIQHIIIVDKFDLYA